MKRRDFLGSASLGAAVALLGRSAPGAERQPAGAPDAVSYRHLPRWRGFNLLEKFTLRRNAPYQERDFAWMARWGFDFVRLPTDYRCWTDPEHPYSLDEKVLGHIDQAIEWGRAYGVHVCLNLHRAPGYCVNPPKEKLELWSSEEAQRQFDFQWSQFARRYRGIPSSRLSFDLVNEPAHISAQTYGRVMRRAAAAIRKEDPQRLLLIDGLRWGRDPVPELVDLRVAQSTRGYDPMRVSHYRASWIAGSDRWPEPTWPLKDRRGIYDRQWLYRDRIVPWKQLERHGVGVHVGEWGAYNKTPHHVALAWMRDWLSLWRQAGWGWALWNLRGSFGIVDSGRADVQYEPFDGHRLDRPMLELLRQS